MATEHSKAEGPDPDPDPGTVVKEAKAEPEPDPVVDLRQAKLIIEVREARARYDNLETIHKLQVQKLNLEIALLQHDLKAKTSRVPHTLVGHDDGAAAWTGPSL